MKYSIYLILFVCLNLHAQYEKQWEVIWNSNQGNSMDMQVAAAQMPDGGIATLGIVSTDILNDFLVRRITSSGNEIWSQRFDTFTEFTGSDLILTKTGMIAATGREEDSSGTYNFRTILLDQDGNVQWDRVYNTPQQFSSDEPVKLGSDSSGNIYVIGNVQENAGFNIGVVKYTTNGNFDWVTSFSGPFGSVNYANSIALEPGGSGYGIGEFSIGPNQFAGGVFRFTNSGNIAWWDTTDLNFHRESDECAILDRDGYLVVLGNSPTGFSILRYDSSGTIITRQDFSTPAIPGNNHPLQLLQRPTSEIIAVVESWDHTVLQYKKYFEQVSNDLNPIWRVVDTLEINSFASSNPVATLAADGHLYYSGDALELFVKSIDINGNISTVIRDSVPGIVSYAINHIQVNTDSSIIIDGEIRKNGLNRDLYTALYSPSVTNSIAMSNTFPKSISLYPNHPNPFNPETTIPYRLSVPGDVELSVYSLLGKKIKSLVNKQQPAGLYSVQWDGTNDFGNTVASGIYLFILKTGDLIQSHKMLLFR